MHGNLVVHRIMDDYSVQGRNSLVKKLLRFCTIRTYISIAVRYFITVYKFQTKQIFYCPFWEDNHLLFFSSLNPLVMGNHGSVHTIL